MLSYYVKNFAVIEFDGLFKVGFKSLIIILYYELSVENYSKFYSKLEGKYRSPKNMMSFHCRDAL